MHQTERARVYRSGRTQSPARPQTPPRDPHPAACRGVTELEAPSALHTEGDHAEVCMGKDEEAAEGEMRVCVHARPIVCKSARTRVCERAETRSRALQSSSIPKF